MSKPCPSCQLSNRDVAVFCRGCATRFPTHATAAPAQPAQKAPRRTPHALRDLQSGLGGMWPRQKPQVDWPTLLLSAVVAVCAFLLWYMGREASLLRSLPPPSVAAAEPSRGFTMRRDPTRIRESTAVAEARAGE